MIQLYGWVGLDYVYGALEWNNIAIAVTQRIGVFRHVTLLRTSVDHIPWIS